MKDNELLYRLGQRLKELRKAKKWSLRDLEALTDIDNSELSKYEFGFISPQLLSLYGVHLPEQQVTLATET